MMFFGILHFIQVPNCRYHVYRSLKLRDIPKIVYIYLIYYFRDCQVDEFEAFTFLVKSTGVFSYDFFLVFRFLCPSFSFSYFNHLRCLLTAL